VFYDCEEVEAVRNGLRKLAEARPEALAGDLAILLEPTYGAVEAGCQGTMRARVTLTGRRAHAARSWLGTNAVHAAGEVLRRLSDYTPRRVDIEGCEYREGLNAVRIAGGVAGNVIPDHCEVEVNYRFAPDRTVPAAEAHLREVFDGYAVEIVDSAPGALPGLSAQPARDFPLLAQAYLDGALKLDEMISARIPLEAINDGFAALQRGETVRSVVMFA